MSPNTTALLTAREVAAVLRMHVASVYRQADAGNLPAIRLPGGTIRFREDALEAWLRDHEHRPEAA
jgi:excisionase family DNA binding protein